MQANAFGLGAVDKVGSRRKKQAAQIRFQAASLPLQPHQSASYADH